MAFAPDYASSGLFYVYYTHDVTPGFHNLRIEEFKRSTANPDLADPGSRRIVLEIPHPDGVNHNGGQLQFGPDKFLYLATGDGNSGPNAQNAGSLLGKLLRIDPRGPGPDLFLRPPEPLPVLLRSKHRRSHDRRRRRDRLGGDRLQAGGGRRRGELRLGLLRGKCARDGMLGPEPLAPGSRLSERGRPSGGQRRVRDPGQRPAESPGALHLRGLRSTRWATRSERRCWLREARAGTRPWASPPPASSPSARTPAATSTSRRSVARSSACSRPAAASPARSPPRSPWRRSRRARRRRRGPS